MIISEILAWVAVIFTILLALKYIARICKNRRLNRLFSKSHKHLGIGMITTGLLHGVLAGNEETTNLFDMELMPKLFTLNLGTTCLFIALLLALTYMFRKKLKKRWMFIHRVLTVLLLVLLVLHVHEEIDGQRQNRKVSLTEMAEQSLCRFWDVSLIDSTDELIYL
ncbi:ferric reductase-like transmembrane domain-containing protein [Paenibacillus sp. FSL K6-2524]|uniref:ferric reductase-like transmembrane domain-containing protein n=1 Tax=Paenibacillus sp. FSL K6-2524 TaxID=2954516 RepID=UPI0030F98E60